MQIAVCSRSMSSFCETNRESLFARYGETVTLKLYDGSEVLAGSDLLHFCAGADAIIVGLERFDKSVISRCKNLKAVVKYGVGYENIDTRCLADRGIMFELNPGANKISVAEHTLMLGLTLAKNIPLTQRLIGENRWSQVQTRQLSSLIWGVLGVGSTGFAVLDLVGGLVKDAIGFDIRPTCESPAGTAMVSSIEELFERADVVSIHIPGGERNKHVVGDKLISLLSGGYLINVSRGDVLDLTSAVSSLRVGKLQGLGLDVYPEEPYDFRSLIGLDNIMCSMHSAGSSIEAREEMARGAIRGLDKVISTLGL